MQLRIIFSQMLKVGAYVICSLVLLACLFEFQYSVLIGPFLDFLLLLGLVILGFLLAVIFLITNGSSKWDSYVPSALLIVAIGSSFITDNISLGHQLHFLLNKGNLELINSLSKKNNVYDMTDMLRYQKRINEAALSNESKYTTQKHLEEAFGAYIMKHNIDPQQLSELRDRLEKSNIISIMRNKDSLILTVDGFVDNEYGYIKTSKKKLKVGDTLPPFGFRIVRLINFDNGWYFFYST